MHTNQLRSALADEARRQAALGDLDMAGYLDENVALVKCAPTEDVGSGPRSAAQGAPTWLMYQPFRDLVVEASEPLPFELLIAAQEFCSPEEDEESGDARARASTHGTVLRFKNL